MLFTWFGIIPPAATTTLASLGEWSKPMFDELLGPALAVAGIIIGCLLIAFFPKLLWQGISKLFHKKEDWEP